ncbi:MAG TPA: hypothetical protein VMW69_11110 [Spirochaetia bacterium]|nr:hypothetical protein [Spirochaetia bacterium]
MMRSSLTRTSVGAAAITALMLWVAAGAFAQSADVTYVEGSVDMEHHGQPRAEANIGDSLNPGDSVITGADGLAQLQKSNLADITVSPGTVFTLRQIDQNGTKQDVLAVSLGSLAFKFNQLGGKEPLIATLSATAGIRGTSLKVYAGADGSSLFVVESGKVSVSGTGGNSVDLTPNEGVEVSPGKPPGEKIKILYGKVDYASWNDQRLQNILMDPAAAVANVAKQLDDYVAKINDLAPRYKKTFEELQQNRSKLAGIKEKSGQKAMEDYYNKEVYPLEALSASLYINLRYYTLSALSLRRYVLGRMYTRITSMYINDENNVVFSRFIDAYRKALSTFERFVVPQLVAADI